MEDFLAWHQRSGSGGKGPQVIIRRSAPTEKKAPPETLDEEGKGKSEALGTEENRRSDPEALGELEGDDLVRAIFDAMDTNHSGTLTKSDVVSRFNVNVLSFHAAVGGKGQSFHSNTNNANGSKYYRSTQIQKL